MGWTFRRWSGSHRVLTKVGGIASLSIPDHRELAPGTLWKLIRLAGSTVEQFCDALGWPWGKGEAFEQLDLGTPTTSTTYTLCVYDTTASSPVLAAKLDVAPSSSLWSDDDPKGVRHKDKAGTSDGVTSLQLKTGAAAKTKVKLTAKGAALPLPAAAGTAYFEQDPKVVVHLFNSEGACWTSEFTSAATKKHDDGSFKAQTKSARRNLAGRVRAARIALRSWRSGVAGPPGFPAAPKSSGPSPGRSMLAPLVTTAWRKRR